MIKICEEKMYTSQLSKIKESVEDLVSNTSLTWREAAIFKNAYEQLDKKIFENGSIVGGYSAKFYLLPKVRGFIPESCDVDIVGREMPNKIFQPENVVPSQLIESFVRKFGSREIKEKIIKSPYPVYRICLPKTIKILDWPHTIDVDTIDYFYSTVGPIEYSDRDHCLRKRCEVGSLEFYISHPSFIIATFINPSAYNENRGRYASLLISYLTEHTFNRTLSELPRLFKRGKEIAEKLGDNEYKRFDKVKSKIEIEIKRKKIQHVISRCESKNGKEKLIKRFEKRCKELIELLSELNEELNPNEFSTSSE